MNYTISELIDLDELQSLCEVFTQLTGFVTAILDMEGEVLTATGWQDICTRFHRNCSPTAARCRESDVYLAGQLQRGEKYTLYRCKNGLIDVTVPITIAGRQVGNLYSGQFLFDPPDREFFRRQAAEFGFDEAAYLEALSRVPVVTEERVRNVMEFLCRLAEMIGRMGLTNKNARRASLVVENSPVVLFRWRAAEGWPVEFVSENIIQFGYTPEDLLSGTVSFASLVHPADLERVTAEVREHSWQGNDLFPQEYRIVTKSGEVRWLDDRTTIERDDTGRITHYQGIVMDITERRRAEDALRHSEKLLRHVFEAIPDLLSVIDRDHRIILSNWHGGYHYVSQELRDKQPLCYQAYYGTDSPCEACHAEEVFRTGLPVFREKYNPRVGFVEIQSFPLFDESGNVVLAIEYVRDITERKRAADALATEKERLAVTLRSIGDGVITADVEGMVVLLNKVAEELTGWTQEEARGKPFEDVFRIVDEKSREPRRSPVQQVLATGNGAELSGSTILVAKDGGERGIADSAAPIRDRESRVVGVVLVFRDITEKKKMEEELFNARKLESLGILAGGIAHDFNNLLTAILGNISLSRMLVPEGDRLHRKLDEAEKASLRARDLTQQLLTFSRGGAPVRKIAHIGGIIRDSATFTLSGSRATCRFSIPDDLYPVEVDEGQISQVINNLIMNADQAMPGGGEIEVSCRNVQVGAKQPLALREGPYVLISIGDRGEGIAEEIIPRIFDPYFTTKKKGKGLGLATVYSIIKNHDAHITVTSRQGMGATFSIYLPAAAGCIVEPVSEDVTPQAGRGTILVMDDEESIREVAGEMLSYLGYDAEFARDGAEAVELYRRALEGGHPFAALLMDLTIPGGMGGREAVGILREMDENVTAIVSSGYSNDPIMGDHRAFGFNGVITKPYKITELKKLLHEVVEKGEGTG